MKLQDLKENWQMRWHGQGKGLACTTDTTASGISENIFAAGETLLDTSVPFSMYDDLQKHGILPDLYFQDNAEPALALSSEDFTYQTEFDLAGDVAGCDTILLHFAGVDTLSDIYLNGERIGETYNMHREWDFPVKDRLKATDNLLEVHFHAPVRFMEEALEKYGSIPSNTDTLDGFAYLRKSACMSGWDWGPKLPDMGLFREVVLLGIDQDRIYSVLIRQKHQDGKVFLSFDVDSLRTRNNEPARYTVTVTAPDGTSFFISDAKEGIVIENPMLWWPNGYGEQPLYTVRVESVTAGFDNNTVHAKATSSRENNSSGCDTSAGISDVWEHRIGLRTMTVRIEKDEWGECFAHEVNGIAIFAMGAAYIPEDCFLPRRSRERTEALIRQCVLANYNALRVWGGAYYPDDWFFDLCDEYGILVWQDLMFACSTYRLTEEFEANISEEITQNIRRIRHHACLALWCGNNEVEDMIIDDHYCSDPKLLGDYTRMYSYVIPRIVHREDPDAFYWPSSPSSGGDFDNPGDETRGDAHFWRVWHGFLPFPAYRRHNYRYTSEFGFEALPSMKTIESFTTPEDRNLFSYVMDRHQRSMNGYGKMMVYISQYFPYPNTMEKLVYASQMMQAQAIRYGIEHWRRHRGQCMGALVWQLNDCWPVVSWSSIDYYGRWKALHYFEKRSFAPILVSCHEEGLLTQNPNLNSRPYPLEKSIRMHVANETLAEQTVTVKWSLRDAASNIIGEEGEATVTVAPLSGTWVPMQTDAGNDAALEFPDADFREHHVYYEGWQDGTLIAAGSVLFSMPKFYRYHDPKLRVTRDGNELTIQADAYTSGIALLNENEDWVLSDNYFDMEAGERHVQILSGDAKEIRIQSVYDLL